MLCQTWSKYCGLRKVVFPSGDVWIQPPKGPELFDESGGWILVGGGNGAGGHNTSLEGELPPPLTKFAAIRPLRSILLRS